MRIRLSSILICMVVVVMTPIPILILGIKAGVEDMWDTTKTVFRNCKDEFKHGRSVIRDYQEWRNRCQKKNKC